MIFKYSTKDAYFVILALGNLALLIFATLSFGKIDIWQSVLLILLLCFAVTTNYQTVAHNFLHNPFFVSKKLNGLFSLVNTMILGVSQTLYQMHHMHHHRYNNDAKDPITGTTNDRTSTWRYGKQPDREENIFTYTFVGFFRQDFMFYVHVVWSKKRHKQVYFETIAWLCFALTMLYLNWQGFLGAFLSVWYLGQCAALFENYLEHHGSIPGDRKTDSVSCYNGFYNWVWFNNGYHQEHHFKPQVHWTKIKTIRSQLPPESHRRVCKGAHWFNFRPPPIASYPLDESLQD